MQAPILHEIACAAELLLQPGYWVAATRFFFGIPLFLIRSIPPPRYPTHRARSPQQFFFRRCAARFLCRHTSSPEAGRVDRRSSCPRSSRPRSSRPPIESTAGRVVLGRVVLGRVDLGPVDCRSSCPRSSRPPVELS